MVAKGEGSAQKKIDAYGLDQLCDDILAGHRYRDIAKRIGVSEGSLINWIVADIERSARAQSAIKMSAYRYEEQAEDVLLDIGPEGTPAQVAVARELSQYYRWKAKCRDRDRYGDQQKVDLTADVKIQSIEQVDAELRQLLKRETPRRGGGRGADDGEED